ncbi:MAG: STAS domain-containing protein [Armatimonadetes bacterium]|jgi:anti-sigma B factor antagonist|nr:STAS domain-containing protein [Armatimonadota bacterium]
MSQVDLQINVNREAGGVPVIKLEGEVDIYTCPQLKDTIIHLIDEGEYHIIIDMEKVPYIDSAGLGVLVGARRRVGEHDGSISIVNPNPSVYKVLEITRLTKIFDVYQDRDAALAATGH